MSVTYWDETPPEETATHRGMVATRQVLCAWADRFAFKAQMLGWPPPMYPYDAFWQARISEVSLLGGIGKRTPHSTDPSMSDWEHARFRLTYRSPGMGDPQPWPSDGDPRHYDADAKISEQVDGNLSALKMNPEQFCWASDHAPLKDGEEPFMMEYSSTYTLSRHGVSYVHANVIDCVGMINAETVYCVFLKDQSGNKLYFPPHTMFYESPSITTIVGPDGLTRFDIVLRFAYRPATWRKWWRADIQDYDSLRIAGTLDAYEWPEETNCALILPNDTA